jgi:hypothetical protein
MPDKRKHRGQHPADAKLFASSQWNKLKQATHDLSWLLSHGYAEKSALKLVGDRFRLKERQRRAVVRSAAAEQAVIQRHSTRLKADQLKGQHLHIDGFNLLITIESAISGGLIFEGVDGCYRDLASIHGSYKRVIETEGAIEMIGKVLEQLKVKKATWYFDKPVSNSGSLKVKFHLPLPSNITGTGKQSFLLILIRYSRFVQHPLSLLMRSFWIMRNNGLIWLDTSLMNR